MIKIKVSRKVLRCVDCKKILADTYSAYKVKKDWRCGNCSLLVRLERLTEGNDHSGWVVELANYLAASQIIKYTDTLVKVAEAIQTIHDYNGEMDSALRQTRGRLVSIMLGVVVEHYGADFADAVKKTR